MEIRQDYWLSEIFGHPVFKLDGKALDDWSGHDPAGGEGRPPVAMYYVKIDTDRVDVVRSLGAIGFYVVDVNLTFRIAANSYALRPEPAAAAYSIREFRAEDFDAVLGIAGSCFRYSRFHLDPLIPVAIAHRIKREWVHSYIRKQRGDKLFVALSDGRPTGFLAVLASDDRDFRVRTIDLIGVDRALLGRGIGQALVTFFVEHYRGECDYLQVGTQAANLPSISLYEKFGFSLAKTQLVMHMHVGRVGAPGADR